MEIYTGNLNITDEEAYKLLIKLWSTKEQFVKSVDYVLDMKQKPWTVYCLGNENASDLELITNQLAIYNFYDFCHKNEAFWSFDILKLLLEKKIPSDLVNNFIVAGSWWSQQHIIIKHIYYNEMSDEAKAILDTNNDWELLDEYKEYLFENEEEWLENYKFDNY